MPWGSIGWMVGVGLGAGVVGGMFGIGGGLIIVPALILGFSFDQKTATGTSLLAQLLPVAILAVRERYAHGEVDVARGLAIAFGLTFGTYFGSKITTQLPPSTMKQAYGVFLVAVGLYFLLGNRTTPVPTKPPAPAEKVAIGKNG